MAIEFRAEPNPPKGVVEEVAALAPTNPFYTSGYVEAMRLSGSEPWILSLCQNGKRVSACTACLQPKFLRRTLNIPSLPALPGREVFWGGLVRFCRKTGVAYLAVGTFASPSVVIPHLAGETERVPRCEHVIDLTGPELWDRLDSGHKRRVNQASKAGLQVRRRADTEACQAHALLVQASMARRKGRGESVPDNIEMKSFLPLIVSGAGELFQVFLDGQILSSELVLRAAKGGYGQSIGTSPQGRACGASTFLLHEVAKILRAEGMELYNLGGATLLSPGLYDYKARFGARQVNLEAATFFLHSAIKRKLITAARLLRYDPARFAKRLLGSPERTVLYAADPSNVALPELS